MPQKRHRPHVIVIGAGFGGIEFCRHFKADADVTLIDRHHHHCFQPLLYQVATAELAPGDVTEPVRSIFAGKRHIRPLMKTVTDVDLSKRRVHLHDGQQLAYDHLLIAAGGKTNYFGEDGRARFAPGLKTLDDALRVRRQLLLSFEKASQEPDAAERQKLLTFLIVGGGPTGVELAGAIAEEAKRVFRRQYHSIDTARARVILVDAGQTVLQRFDPKLGKSAIRQLESLGVQVRLGMPAEEVAADHVRFKGGEVIESYNILWGGGIVANPLAGSVIEQLGGEERAGVGGRIRVEKDLSLPGHPEVFAVGDITHLEDKHGQPLVGLAPVAQQQGTYVARTLNRELKRGKRPEDRKPFWYFDKGRMAVIGRRRAVAAIGPFRFGGTLAWLLWLFVHLFYLIGYRNRFTVLGQWLYAYIGMGRGGQVVKGKAHEVEHPMVAASR